MAAPVLQQQSDCLKTYCTKSARHPNDSTGSILPHEKACQHKHHRDQSAYEDIEEQPSAKRTKAPAYKYPPEFWNALSNIRLTRSALKEFDRRNTKEKITPRVEAVKRSTRLLRSDTKRLLCFAKNGGPNLNHLRGYSWILQAAASMSQSILQDSGLPGGEAITKTPNIGPYDSHFQQMLADKRVFLYGCDPLDGNMREPSNVDSIRKRLTVRRSSLSPLRFTNDDFLDFQRANQKATSELKFTSSVIPTIIGAKDSRFETEENRVFNNIEKFAPGLKMAQPDKYYGARPDQAGERVRCDLGKYIVPSTDTSLPIAPNFFLEGKSTAGRPDVAQRQVMHDNAIGARAMHQLQNYGRETPVFDGKAYTIGASYHPGTGTLQLYSTHPRQSASGRTEYCMTQLCAYAMTGTAESCRQGIAACRNARDFTKEQRDRLLVEANNTAARSDLAASDELDGNARPRKHMKLAASTGRLHSGTHGPTPHVQASHTTIREIEMIDREQDRDEDEDEDEDDVYAAIHGQSATDEIVCFHW